jgi:predicted GIY-YIG superfamily endonuclease
VTIDFDAIHAERRERQAARRAEIRRAAHDVYWLFDAEDRVLYIGCTQNLVQRLEQHSTQKDWWSRVSRVEAVGYPDRASAHSAESAAIYAERPIFNKKVPVPKRPLPPIIRRDEPIHAVESEAS